jgi:hypothetical protein
MNDTLTISDPPANQAPADSRTSNPQGKAPSWRDLLPIHPAAAPAI